MSFTEYDKEVLEEIWGYLLDKTDDCNLTDEVADLVQELYRLADDLRDEMMEGLE